MEDEHNAVKRVSAEDDLAHKKLKQDDEITSEIKHITEEIKEHHTKSAKEEMAEQEDVVQLVWKWAGKEFILNLTKTQTIANLKDQLYFYTNVLPKRQKLIMPGKIPSDEAPVGSISWPKGKKFMMVGTPEAQIFKELDPSEIPDVFNDLDLDYSELVEDPALAPENRKKLDKIIKDRDIIVMNPPRPGKKLLVLDLDFTLMDVRTMREVNSVGEVKRPGLDDFLTSVYPHYDIAIWSQTHWRWIEIKLTELNMLTSPNYNISFVLDRTFMFPITTKKEGKPYTHEVKPLEVIWNKIPAYSKKNSVHVDDLSRNFAMNPVNGIKIKAFKNSKENMNDKELFYLTKYLLKLAEMEDVSIKEHRKWKKEVKKHLL